MAKKTNQVTRRVVESRKIEIYKVDTANKMTLLLTQVVSGRISETALAKEHKIDKKKGESIFVKTISEKVINYAMPTEEFMKYAVVVRDEVGDVK